METLPNIGRCIRKLVMAGRNFGGPADTRPVVQMGNGVRGAQNREAEAGRISESELKRAGLGFRRLSQHKRRWLRRARGIVKLSSGTGVAGIKTSRHQNFSIR